ncbi:D-3-phosphoglycerate dehydrogenase/(S)-sulfolactate dehydrogenase [Tamaricihabitans halophyticus]|uniref:D-3-phosphoglycerate dehydrogenase/(S)-sulfolactate dehydrogenase n=1 Tax=Tamaricihabitans halophyticus TaxID=1262583 RepID=A0A4V2SRZ0_9PSEU|nr:NAD(P)-dependent oxidoreductase [Tamaricihabitans halophyticus]TCP44726.1 D-3-phosphoglycerate dehydrogenase/(S)-sulfolactate dehydrogenase [Tamaricihabitans halophyticus]
MASGKLAGPVAVVEDVAGAALDRLALTHDIRWEPDAWVDPDLLRHVMCEAHAVVVRNKAQITAQLLDAAPDLRIVARAGVGLDNIDIAAANAAGVVVSAARGANAVSVAEHTVLLALGVLRDVVAQDRAVRDGTWNRVPGRELSGKTWGLLGLGATGRAVAELLRGFRMRVVAHDPYVSVAEPWVATTGVELTDLDTVLGAADVLSVHLPETAETAGLLDAVRLAAMKPNAVLVNVGRGAVVDEQALADAVRAGALGGAGLDVRAVEPPGASPLDAVSRVLYTPHIAGITEESQERIVQLLAEDIEAVLAGQSARNAVGSVGKAR